MKSMVVYFSQYGNTQKIAEVVSDALAQAGQSQALSLEAVTPAALQDVELLVVGSPTHRMKLPETAVPILKSWPRRALRGKRVAAFDTSYKMSAWLARMTAARKLARRLRKLGGRPAVGPETFHVEGREGPLCEGEIERSRAWAIGILERLESDGAREMAARARRSPVVPAAGA